MKAVKAFLSKYLTAVIVVAVLLVIALFAALTTQNEDGTRTFNGKGPIYSEAQEQAYCEAKASNDKAIAEFTGIDVVQDSGSGCAPTDIPQLGTSVYYSVDVSTPTAFYNAVNGKGFNEGYGLQCVAGFKEFMFALSGKYVATKTGGASGYAQQQGQIEPLGFKWYGGSAGLQDGDWGIFGNGQYGHVAMYYQGKWFGQNQAAANANAGNAFNLLGIGNGGLLGYYRPNIYQKSTPAPVTSTPTPKPSGNSSNTGGSTAPATSNTYTVVRGDTLGNIILKAGWYSGTQGLYGDDGYAQKVADFNGVSPRGLIYPGTVLKRP